MCMSKLERCIQNSLNCFLNIIVSFYKETIITFIQDIRTKKNDSDVLTNLFNYFLQVVIA